MTAEKKDETKTPTPDELYDEAWEEGDEKDGEEKEKKPGEKEDDAKKDGTADPEAEKKPDTTANKDDRPAPDQTPKPLEGVEKALHDTKAYASRLAEENAKLRKAVAANSTSAIAAAKESQKKAEDALRSSLEEAYKDYPELKTALDSITGELKAVKEKITARDEAEEKARLATEERREIVAAFEREIKPEIIKVHSDFDAIVQDPKGDFFRWAEKQSPAIQAAVYNSMVPADIIWAVGEYKKARSSGDIEKLKAQEDAKKENNLNLAHALRGGANKIPSSAKKDDKNDYDAGWDQAGKILEKQGVV